MMQPTQNELITLAKETITAMCGSSARTGIEIEHAYRDEWYTAFDPDFYSRDEYLWLVFYFWRKWTNGNVKRTIDFFKRHSFDPKTLIDLGAGLGLSTIQFALAFPKSTIVYENLPGKQIDVFTAMIDRLGIKNVEIMSELDQTRCYNVICAYEMMEHLHDPTTFIAPILASANFYIDASSFAFTAPGHFPTYRIDGVHFSAAETKRQWNRWLRKMGFDAAPKLGLMPRSFFNDRPKIWVRRSVIK